MSIFNEREKLLRHKAMTLIYGTIGLLAVYLFIPVFAKAEPNAFAYVNKNYIITAEVANEHTFVVKFINLSDYVLVIQPSEFIYRGASGQYYVGQVFEKQHKDLRGEGQRYSASILLKGHTFAGLNIAGAFHEQEQIDELSIRIGARRFYLQPLDKTVFDQLAKKISNLDLENADSISMLEAANISELGSSKVTDGSPEWDHDWQGLIAEGNVNSPKILKRPDISPTIEAVKTHTYGKVKLSGIINKDGNIQDLKVLRGLGRGMDERAIEGVKNSWVFLPATKSGEVIDTQISIEVEFPYPDKK